MIKLGDKVVLWIGWGEDFDHEERDCFQSAFVDERGILGREDKEIRLHRLTTGYEEADR